MAQLERLASYMWPTDAFPIASLNIRVQELASRLGLAVSDWEVDGLGPASGFGCRLPSGRVLLLEELELSVKYQGSTGPYLYLDAAEVAENEPEDLMIDILGALGLSDSDVRWVNTVGRQEAARLTSIVRAARSP
ncbi:MAG: hypothetical protein K2R98_00490 [Gemmataceae bacterium]|nr:hypothetical protein [Gemmataceae bacterium]